jgi:hypothetical protein
MQEELSLLTDIKDALLVQGYCSGSPFDEPVSFPSFSLRRTRLKISFYGARNIFDFRKTGDSDQHYFI